MLTNLERRQVLIVTESAELRDAVQSLLMTLPGAQHAGVVGVATGHTVYRLMLATENLNGIMVTPAAAHFIGKIHASVAAEVRYRIAGGAWREHWGFAALAAEIAKESPSCARPLDAPLYVEAKVDSFTWTIPAYEVCADPGDETCATGSPPLTTRRYQHRVFADATRWRLPDVLARGGSWAVRMPAYPKSTPFFGELGDSFIVVHPVIAGAKRVVYGRAKIDDTHTAYVQVLIQADGRRVVTDGGRYVVGAFDERGCMVHVDAPRSAGGLHVMCRKMLADLMAGTLVIVEDVDAAIRAVRQWDGTRDSPHAPFIRALLYALAEHDG